MRRIDNAALSQIPLFSNTAPDSRRLLCEQGGTIHIDKGMMIFAHGAPASHFYSLHSGLLRLYRESESGDEAIIEVSDAPALLGIEDFFNEGLYENNAESLRDCVLFSFPVTCLDTLIEQDPVFARNLCRHLAGAVYASNKALELTFTQQASQRIGCFLLRQSDGRQQGAATIQLPFEKTLVAGMLGMRAETFSRGLNKLYKELGVTAAGMTIDIPDIAALARYTCSACSGEYPCLPDKSSASANA